MKKETYYRDWALQHIHPNYHHKEYGYTVVPWTKVKSYLKDAFNIFRQIFPEHVGQHNSGFIIQRRDSQDCYPHVRYTVWFYCGHYEGGCKESLLACNYFLNEIERLNPKGYSTECHVELLDCAAEKLLIEIYMNDYMHLWEFFERMKINKKNKYTKITEHET